MTLHFEHCVFVCFEQLLKFEKSAFQASQATVEFVQAQGVRPCWPLSWYASLVLKMSHGCNVVSSDRFHIAGWYATYVLLILWVLVLGRGLSHFDGVSVGQPGANHILAIGSRELLRMHKVVRSDIDAVVKIKRLSKIHIC